VVIFLESFSYHKTDFYGSPINTTPHFTALARDGLFFKNFFTPHIGTARAVFSTLTGIPDVETHNTSTRNPMIVCQTSLVNAFGGHQKFYFLGGSASWGNIRGLISHNIPGITIYEEGDYDSPRVDVWGISDLALFQEANAVLKQQKKPFFAIIQTAGNHRPFTIPKDNDGFVTRSLDSKTLDKNGFESAEAWNAFRLLDHSLGRFIEKARQESYFDNTLFVFFGDHGMMDKTTQYMPQWERELNLHGLHVPFVIYGPKLIPQGKVYTTLASLPDILPTLAGLALDQYQETTLGRNLLDPRFDSARAVFTIAHSAIPQIGLLDNQFYFTMNEGGTHPGLFALDGKTPGENMLAKFPEKGAIMRRFLTGVHETSKYMLYHAADGRSECTASAGRGSLPTPLHDK
jgi:phosphoglycerol transferase MdoB-like AlkP superfamily enzyme